MRSRTKDVYQHQVFEPLGMMIEPMVLEDQGGDHVVIKFALSPLLDRDMVEFELMLLWSINVLQENAGTTGVFASDASASDYKATITLDWQIFPPGTVDEVFARLTGSARPVNAPDFERHVRDRVRLFESFNPTNYIRGQGGFELMRWMPPFIGHRMMLNGAVAVPEGGAYGECTHAVDRPGEAQLPSLRD